MIQKICTGVIPAYRPPSRPRAGHAGELFHYGCLEFGCRASYEYQAPASFIKERVMWAARWAAPGSPSF